MNRYWFLLACVPLALFARSAAGSDCKGVSKKNLYIYSDLVFIGQFVHENDDSYILNVIENFKGEIDSTIVIGKEFSPLLNREKLWLIYGNKRGENIIISPCSGTKRFTMPFGQYDLIRAKMPPEHVRENQTLDYLYESNLLYASLNELQLDIISLRQWKMEDQLTRKIEDQMNSWRLDSLMFSSQYLEIQNQNKIMMGMLIFLTALLIIFGILLYLK